MQRQRSASLVGNGARPTADEKRIEKNVRSIRNTSAMAALRLHPSANVEPDPSIVEGFREDVRIVIYSK